ncbi:hypothetical protein H8R17_32795 [Streptomyces sp. TRM68367]|nr:hypothetical protein [Streptomyces sp. TRM68367]
MLLADLEPGTTYNITTGGVNNGPSFQVGHVHGGVNFTVPSAYPTGATVKPDQVPAPPVRYSNRVAELARLNSVFMSTAGHCEGEEPDVAMLWGVSGVGKRALACKWAAGAKALFPGGQLYVDLGGLRGRSVIGISPGTDVSEGLASCLRGLGVADVCIPDSVAERSALLRSRSAGRRVLVVLDGVTQAAQVRPFLPKGPGSGVLVISPLDLGELVADGARPIPVKPLDMAGGLELLADRCGAQAVERERAAAERLVQLCGGLPVALQIVVARLLGGEGLDMASLAVELEDEAGRLAELSLPALVPGEEYSVSTALGPSYRLLPPDAARLYRRLGWAPYGLFDAGVAAVAGSFDIRTVKRLLRTLVGAGLVEKTGDDRYRMHDLIRLHARACAAQEEPAGEEKAVVERVVTHYVALVALADRAIREDRLRCADLSSLLSGADDPFSAVGGPAPLPWLDAEHPAILAVLRAAAGHGLHVRTYQLSEAFTVLFLHRRYLAAWKESLQLGIDAAVAAAASAETAGAVAEATAVEARLLSLRSRPLLDLDENDLALQHLETAVARADTTGDLRLQASVQEFFGRYLDRVDPRSAVDAYRRSLDLNTRSGEARGAAIASYFLGCAQDALEDHAVALTTLREARRDLLALGKPDLRMAARTMAAIGVVHGQLGEVEEALRVLGKAADDLHAVNGLHYEAQALVDRADIAEAAGDRSDLVRDCLTRAHAIYEHEGSPLADELRRRLDGMG